jgi:anti-sigma regulatory factor (Ser/Thr protein kinase)
VRNILTTWCEEDHLGDALVVVSELVTNAVRHAPCPEIGVTVTCGDGLVLIEVEDSSASPPILHHVPEAGTEGGRGLGLVQSLTADWGWTPWDGGAKRVWALLPVSERACSDSHDTARSHH